MTSVEKLIEPLRHSPQLPQAVAILQAQLEAERMRREHYLLESNGFSLALKSGSGMLACRVISGLSLPIEAIFDEQKNLEVIRKIRGN